MTKFSVLELSFSCFRTLFLVSEHPFLFLESPFPVLECPFLLCPVCPTGQDGKDLHRPVQHPNVLSLGKILSLSRCPFVLGQ